MTWGHDALAEDLASHLTKDGKAFAWTNIELPGCDGGRPDVLVFPRWRYHSPTLNAFEVKVSVADLERDLKAGKWSKYLGACSSVTFAMPTGLAKAAVFGFVVALMGCYQGMNSGRGAQGVGRATTQAVVSASILILASNYLLTEVFFSA